MRRTSLTGAVTGAVLGAVGRVAIVLVHSKMSGADTAFFTVAAAVFGALIGALAGLTGRPLLGAVIGGGLSLVTYLGLVPVALLFRALGGWNMASVVEVVAVGLISGGVGGAMGRRG